MSYTLTFTGDFGPESTGATMRCQLYDSAGSASGGALSGVVELGSTGVFQYTATLTDGFRGSLVMYELADATNRAGFGINPQEAENTDVKTSTRATPADVTAAVASAGASITVISAVDGGNVTLRQGDTWRFTVTITGVTLTDYEAIAFGVKKRVTQDDDEATLLVRTDTGLVRVAGAAPVSAGNGTLTVGSATTFTVVVHMAETVNVAACVRTWYLKAFETGTTPDEGFTLATGSFTVAGWGVEAVS